MNLDALEDIVSHLSRADDHSAALHLQSALPFTSAPRHSRAFTDRQKLTLFLRDGFVDRYSGDRLINPGLLRAISVLLPELFPYRPNWKAGVGHPAYWALCPTYDHVVPIAQGGADTMDNVVTTSQRRNSAKAHWSLDELGWTPSSWRLERMGRAHDGLYCAGRGARSIAPAAGPGELVSPFEGVFARP